MGDRVSSLGQPSTTIWDDNLTSHFSNFDGPWNGVRWRRLARVVSTQITCEAIAYYHNFHDTTSQAIRDSNYKPNVPANLLTYNTYAESPINISKSVLLKGGTVNMNLSCNNLTFGLTFMVRRKAHLTAFKHETSAFQDFSQTLPIKSVTLTGSGQQIYKASGAECLLIDQWDHELSSMKAGKAVTNTSGLYADNLASSHVSNKPQSDHFFGYYIPFGFSSDMSYNSGSLALQVKIFIFICNFYL